MKRLVYYVSIALMALSVLSSCHKDRGGSSNDGSAPSIQWQANSSFSVVEISESMEALLGIEAPGGISSFKITVDVPSADYIGIVNQSISVSSNKGSSAQKKSPVLDLTLDAKSAAAVGAAFPLVGKTSCSVNLVPLIKEMVDAVPPANDDKFVFGFAISDEAGRKVTRNVNFHWTAAPEVLWPKNTDFKLMDITDKLSAVLKVSAPAGIETLSMTVESPCQAWVQFLNSMISTASNKGTSPVLDLIDDASVASTLAAMGISTGKSLRGKASADVDLSSLIPLIVNYSPEPGSLHKFTIEATDAFGRSSRRTAVFQYK